MTIFHDRGEGAGDSFGGYEPIDFDGDGLLDIVSRNANETVGNNYGAGRVRIVSGADMPRHPSRPRRGRSGATDDHGVGIARP